MTARADQLLKMDEVAARLAVGLQTAYRRVYGGEIEWIDVRLKGARRAKIRVPESALVEYEQRRLRAGAA